MKDSRYTQLAKNLINYSTDLKPGENILIEALSGTETPLVSALINEAYKAGGYPHISLHNQLVHIELLNGMTVELAQKTAEFDLARMKEMQAYIGIRGSDNIYETGDVPQEKLEIYQKYYSKPVHTEQRVGHTKWCVMRYPNPSMAQLAQMSTEVFEDFFFDVCNLDYGKMSAAMDPLSELIEATDKVRITGSGTDLSFSIKGMPAVKCAGKRNIPDGEIYSAPIIDSVNGTITYNAPSVYQGTLFENVCFTFRDGKIVEASAAGNTTKLNEILDTDAGARFIGEFSIGLNPYILEPMKDTLFDEKISGSIHFTPGNAYKECNNGNVSAIHWDLVLIQRPEYGGGEITFDGKVIRKDGLFVLPALAGLNPDALK